jgi:hypothetical protein
VTVAHIAGMPVEETLLELAPVAVAFVAALRMARDRARRRLGR